MRIGTNLVFDRGAANMSRLSSRADQLQVQIATGKRVTFASDDPTAFARASVLKRGGASAAAYADNLAFAQGLLQASDSALGAVTGQLQRVQELALAAANGTYSATDRKIMAAELKGIGDDLFALVNTTDSRGVPIFGGATGDVAAVRNADGSVVFPAGGTPSPIPIGEGQSVQATDTADRLFGGNPDMFAAIAGLTAALEANDVGGVSDSLDGISGALDRVTVGQASLGARAMRLDFEVERLANGSVEREAERSALEDTDVTAAITELQKTLTTLEATQASFTKLTSLSLFDYLR